MEHTQNRAMEIVDTCTRTATLVHVKTGAEPYVTADCFISLGRGGFWNISTNLAVCLRCLLGISTAGSLLHGHRYEGKREVDYSWYNASLSTANLPTNVKLGSETHCVTQLILAMPFIR